MNARTTHTITADTLREFQAMRESHAELLAALQSLLQAVCDNSQWITQPVWDRLFPETLVAGAAIAKAVPPHFHAFDSATYLCACGKRYEQRDPVSASRGEIYGGDK